MGGQDHALTTLPLEINPVLIVKEVGCAPGPACTGAENHAYTGIRSPGRPTRRESLYRLRYDAASLNREPQNAKNTENTKVWI